MIWYQQGDVTIKPVHIPAEAKRAETTILARGEVTGHAHRVVGDAELLRLGRQLFLRVLGGEARVVHEEHAAIAISKGEYEIGRVREYDHCAEEERAVWD